MQVYAAALYVEAGPARTELQRLRDEGFFEQEGFTTDRLTAALAAGRFRHACMHSTLTSQALSLHASFTGHPVSLHHAPRQLRACMQGLRKIS